MFYNSAFLFTTPSRPVLEPIRPTIQWLTGALSLMVKRPGCEADHSRGQECVELYFYTPNSSSWCDAQLKKHRDNFTFTFYLYMEWYVI